MVFPWNNPVNEGCPKVCNKERVIKIFGVNHDFVNEEPKEKKKTSFEEPKDSVT